MIGHMVVLLDQIWKEKKRKKTGQETDLRDVMKFGLTEKCSRRSNIQANSHAHIHRMLSKLCFNIRTLPQTCIQAMETFGGALPVAWIFMISGNFSVLTRANKTRTLCFSLNKTSFNGLFGDHRANVSVLNTY